MIRPPRSFRVLGNRYDVRIVPIGDPLASRMIETKGSLGLTSNDESFVRIRAVGPGGQSVYQQMDTYLHEALHALVLASDARGYLGDTADEQRATEEGLVHTLSAHLLAFLRDNPRVVAYLTQRLP